MRNKNRNLPAGWRWETIGNHILDYQSGVACGDKSKDKGYAHLRMNNISKDFKLDLSLLWRIPPSAIKEDITSYSAGKDDILFNNTNSPELVGKSCLFNLENQELFLFSNHLTRIKTKASLTPYYLLSWIHFLWLKRYFETNCTIWNNQAAIRVEEKLFPLSIPLPPTIDDQIRIATELERKMAEVEKMRQAALRRKEAISAMQGAILRGVFPWEEGDELPQGWAWNRLREVCFINPSRSKGFSREPNAPTTFVPMEAVDELTGTIIKKITRPYSEIAGGYTYFEEGDVLFAKITPCMENGRSAIAENLLDGVGFGSTEFHVLRAGNNLTKEWVYHFIRTKEFRRRAEKKFNGSAGQQRVPTDFIKNSFIPFPTNPDEQIHITSELQHKLAEIVKISQYADRELEAIEALPGAILREVFDCGPESGVDDSDKEQVQQ